MKYRNIRGKNLRFFPLFKHTAVNILFQTQLDYLKARKFHCVKTELLYWKMFDITKSKRAHIQKIPPYCSTAFHSCYINSVFLTN